MRIVGVPVVDRNPVQFGSEISRDVGHQLAGEGAEIAKLSGILRRNDKSKMMAVVPAAFGKGAFIRRVQPRVEHPGVRTVARHALALQIGDVLGQWCRAKAGAVVTNHARLHHHASRGRAERQGERGTPAPSEMRPARSTSTAPETVADMPGPLGRPHDLADKALRTRGATSAVANATKTNTKVAVPLAHNGFTANLRRPTAPAALISLTIWSGATAWPFVVLLKTSTRPTTCARPEAALFPCHPRHPRRPRSLVPRAQLSSQQTLGTRGDLRQNAIRVMRWILQ